LGVAQSTVRAWSDAGRLPVFYTPGGHRRFKEDDLHAFLSRNGAGSRPRNAATVLIVDDDPRLREVIRVNLEYDGMVVKEASTAEEGLRALEGGDPPDLVMLDVMMPGMDGWQTCEQLKSNPQTSAIPVIMLTSLDGLDVPETAARVGAASVLIKPCPVERLAFAIKAALH
jgi:excisionase family DNA binding protein